jgi:outer membrane protein assembly factor BamB
VKFVFLLALVCPAAEWSQFRGPNAAGVAEETGLPVEFGPEKNVVWKTRLAVGNSSPVLAGDRIFLTGHEGDRLITFCIDRTTGKILWRREVSAQRQEPLHKLNDRAAPTPATDGKNVYAFFGDFGLVSYGPDGNERWRMPLGPFSNLHGMAASPILVDGKLIQVCDQDVGSYLLAVDAETGRVAWRTDRGEVVHGFSTPAVYRPREGPAHVIVPGSYQMIAYAADTGKKLWWVRGTTWQVKSAPVIDADVLYFNGWAPGGDPGEQVDIVPFAEALAKIDADQDGRISKEEVWPSPWKPSGTFEAVDLNDDQVLDERDWTFYRARRSARNTTIAVKLGGEGDVTDSHVLWRFNKSIPDVPCPLLYRGVLYLIRTGGILTTLNPKTGEILKQGRVMGALEGYYASPVGADGKVYLLSQEGKAVVLRAAGQWEILAINDLEDGGYATPAIGDGKIYLRTRNTLYCFGQVQSSR